MWLLEYSFMWSGFPFSCEIFETQDGAFAYLAKVVKHQAKLEAKYRDYPVPFEDVESESAETFVTRFKLWYDEHNYSRGYSFRWRITAKSVDPEFIPQYT